MNNVFALLIKMNTTIALVEIQKLLPVTFKSYEYMQGFLDGYLFDNYKLLELSEYQDRENKRKLLMSSDLLDTHWLVFVSLEIIDEDD